MAAKDPTAVAAKWSRNLGNAGESIRLGVQSVTEAPGVAAARSKALYLRRVQESVDKWATRVASVPLPVWQDRMINLGLARISQGAQANEPKFAAFMSEFLPHVENVARQVRAMPKGTMADSEARVIAQMRGNAAFRRRG